MDNTSCEHLKLSAVHMNMSSGNILQTDNMNKYYYKNKDKHNNRNEVLFSLGCSQLCILIIKHNYRKVYRITAHFCGNLISAVFCGQLRTAEIKIAEYYVK